MTAGTHGSTYAANPLAMAVGNAVVDLVADPALLAHVGRWACCCGRGWPSSKIVIRP